LLFPKSASTKIDLKVAVPSVEVAWEVAVAVAAMVDMAVTEVITVPCVVEWAVVVEE
jgi:hypothetical protein